MNSEPLITAGSVALLAAAAIGLLANFGVPITGDQSEALLVLVGVISPFLIAFLRAQPWVTPAGGGVNWPVFNAATVGTIASAIIGTCVAFGVPINETQGNALLTFIGAAAPLVIAVFVARSQVTPLAGPRNTR